MAETIGFALLVGAIVAIGLLAIWLLVTLFLAHPLTFIGVAVAAAMGITAAAQR